jgi:hypothetical protein
MSSYDRHLIVPAFFGDERSEVKFTYGLEDSHDILVWVDGVFQGSFNDYKGKWQFERNPKNKLTEQDREQLIKIMEHSAIGEWVRLGHRFGPVTPPKNKKTTKK